MLVLITYDISTDTIEGRKRLRKVSRECLNYGQRVQNSVFECNLNSNKLNGLKDKLSKIIDNSTDSIRIYNLGNNYTGRIEKLGKDTSYDAEQFLLVI